MKYSLYRGKQRSLYPAAGLQSDLEALLQKFVETKSIRFEEFSRIWRASNFALIHAGRTGLREKREFCEEAFRLLLKFVMPPYTLQVRVGAVYTIYGVYHTQRMSPKVRVRMPLSCWADVAALHREVSEHKHLDVDYIIRRMKHRDHCFDFVAYPAPIVMEDLYNKTESDEESGCGVDESEVGAGWRHEDASALNQLIGDDDGIGQLKAVHDKYHLLKCKHNAQGGGEASKPNTSLDLIQEDVADVIISTCQQLLVPTAASSTTSLPLAEQRETGDKPAPARSRRGRKKKPVEESSGETSKDSPERRARRLQEIKWRAAKSRANTDSGSLRYLNTSPQAGNDNRWTGSSDRSPPIKHRRPGRPYKRPGDGPNKQLPSGDDRFSISTLAEGGGDAEQMVKGSEGQSRVGRSEGEAKAVREKRSFQGDVLSMSEVESDEDYCPSNKKKKKRKMKPSAAGRRPKRMSSVEDEGAGEKRRRSSSRRSRPRPSYADCDEFEDVPEDDGTGGKLSSGKSPKEEVDFKPAIVVESAQSLLPAEVNVCDVNDMAQDGQGGDDENVAVMSSSGKGEKGKSLESLPSVEESKKIEVMVGMLVALRPRNRRQKERPLIARVTDVSDITIGVEWQSGTGYADGDWRAAAGIPREQVTRRRVLLAGFTLTAGGRLPASVVANLRRMYDELDNS